MITDPDVRDLFDSCRRGDVERVRFLIEFRLVELNIRDEWDSTPLYYACLCGHDDLVEVLLSHGAQCEKNTFDGERCHYAALTYSVRQLLHDHKAITAQCMQRDPYQEFLRKCLERSSEQSFADMLFIVHGEKFWAHRVILSARCSYFHQMFNGRWKDRHTIHLHHPLISVVAFKALLEYLYTGFLHIAREDVEDCRRLARQCKLADLRQALLVQAKQIDSFAQSKPGTHVTMLSITPQRGSLPVHCDMSAIAHQLIPRTLQTNYDQQSETISSTCTGSSENEGSVSFLFPDLCLVVNGHHFPCHKAVVCGRSDYFRAMITGQFAEGRSDGCSLHTTDGHAITCAHLRDVTPQLFAVVMEFLYSDRIPSDVDNMADLLVAADMYLLPGLKRLCTAMIGFHLDGENAVAAIRLARLFSLQRLELQATKTIAQHLNQVILQDGFLSLVSEDAASIQHREETDSIPLIDDIRFHLNDATARSSTLEGAAEHEEKLALLENFLEQHNLSG